MAWLCYIVLSSTRYADAPPRITMSGATGTDPVESLVLDLLDWIGPDGRPYVEALEAWRTSCPRLPVWEEADSAGFLMREYRGSQERVRVSPRGQQHLESHRAAGRRTA
jgi:D-3-phosphoglycerate dehydrogenase